ncbi:MAG: AMP-binding protein [Lachnospiraceae bacterium]|nr:AMP-binding protein [Lachnospiraceae bacterium]
MNKMLADLQEFVFEINKLYKDRIAYRYIVSDKIVDKTFADLGKDVFAVATWLKNYGMRGEKIAIIGKTSYPWIVTFLASAVSGNIVIPIDKMLPKEEILHLIKEGGARIVFLDEEFEPWMKEIREIVGENGDVYSFSGTTFREMLRTEREKLAKVKPEDPCLLLFTSGTTGTGKGVLISHKNVVANINEIYRMDYPKDVDGDPVVMSVLPIYHTFELTVGNLGILYTGTTICINDKLENVVENLKRFKPSVMVVVPAIAEMIYKKIMEAVSSSKYKKKVKFAKRLDNTLSKVNIDAKRSLYKSIYDAFGGKLTTIVVGGSALRPEIAKTLDEFGFHIYQGYGMTECAPLIAANYPGNDRIGSVGKPVSYMNVKIINEEIVLRGDGVMLSYYNNPEENEKAFVNGWFKTGDLGYIDNEGYLYITGRAKNLIILDNGKNIYPEEIESYLLKIPSVKDAFVYEDHGKISALIVPESMKENTIRSIKSGIRDLNEKVPAYKRVVGLSFRPSDLPKTTTLKTKRNEVMKWIEQKNKERKAEYVAPSTAEQKRLCSAMEQVLKVTNVGIKDDFFERGGDSLSALEFATIIGVPAQDIYEFPTVELLEENLLNGSSKTESESAKVDVNALLNHNRDIIVDSQPQCVLLTGATGFLGAHILRELLNKNLKVVCLVRNVDKLRPTLKSYFPKDYEKFSYKVVKGDIELEKFGLTNEEYEILCNKVDMVFHVAANVHHAGHYEDFERSNVIGTQHVIDFCMDANAILQHTSTASINGAGTVVQSNPNAKFDEFTLDIGQQYTQNVYIHSKYKSEERVLIARENGLKANIFRIGNLTWRKSDGMFQKNASDNGFLERLKGLLKLRMYSPEIAEYPIDFTAVDECAEAYVLLALNHHVNNIYNLYNPNVFNLEALCKKFMLHAKRVPKEVFEKSLREQIHDKEVMVLSFYNAIASSSSNVPMSNAYTTAELEKLGFKWSKIGLSYLRFIKNL